MYMSLMVKMMDWKRDGFDEGVQEGRMNMLKQYFTRKCLTLGRERAILALKEDFDTTDEEIALILKETPETANA